MKLTLNKQTGRFYAHLKTGNPSTPVIRMTLGTTDPKEARKKAKDANLQQIEATLQAGALSQQAIARLVAGRKLNVAEACVQWVESLQRRARSDATIAKSESVMAHWFKVVPEVSGLPPLSVTEDHVDRFINRESSAGQSSRARELSVLRTFFGYCADFGLVNGNPAGRNRVAIKHRQLSHEQRVKKKVLPFTQKEVDLVMEGTEGWDRWFIGIAAATGLRLGDIAQLEHAAFAVPGCIVVPTNKRDRLVQLPINDKVTPGLSQLLAEIPPNDSKYLFPDQKKQYDDIMAGRPKFSVYFGRLFEHFGIKGKSFHGLRHMAITRWHEQGFSLEECKTFAGHTSTKVHEGYVHT